MSKQHSQGVAEVTLNTFLALFCPNIRYEAVLIWRREGAPGSEANDPTTQVQELTLGSLSTYFVRAAFSRVIDWRECFAGAAAKLYQRANGISPSGEKGAKRGQVPADVTARALKALSDSIPEGSDDERELVSALEFFVQAYKAKNPPSQLTLTGYLADGSTVKVKVAAKDVENASRFCSLFERVIKTVDGVDSEFNVSEMIPQDIEKAA